MSSLSDDSCFASEKDLSCAQDVTSSADKETEGSHVCLTQIKKLVQDEV